MQMFIKFFKHDLEYGIGHAKKRLILTFLGFFILSIYHFWVIRMFEISATDFLNTPATTADYFIALIGGCGKVTFMSGMDNDFSMPTIWFMFILWMQFVSLYYPFNELNGIGKHLMVLSGGRGIWWFSKCAWTVVNTIASYLLIFLSSTICGLCFGAKLSMNASWYLFKELAMNMDDLTTSVSWNITSVFFMVGFVLVALALLQLLLSLLIKPLFSYFLLVGYFFAGAYFQYPALFSNYAMPARNALLVTTGLDMTGGVVIGLWISVLSVIIGYYVFKNRDILDSDMT